jgi:enoyl-CoA hydratase/carnithine racemase
MTEHVHTELVDRILTVRFNRADKKNAITLAMYQALTRAFHRANDDAGIRAILLTGSGDSFSAGNDLGDFLKTPSTAEDSAAAQFLQALSDLDKPLVAAVNGLAIGIGVTVLMHCDLVYAADSASFHMPFVSLGLCPEAGASYLMPATMGHARAAELLLLGERFTALTARDYGIVNAVLPADAVLPHAREKCRRLASMPPGAVHTTRRLLKRGSRAALQEMMRYELDQFGTLLRSPEAMEAIGAFMNARKRDPSQN